MKKIIRFLILFLLSYSTTFVHAQTDPVEQLMTKITTQIQNKTLEQQKTTRKSLISKIPKIMPASSNKSISVYAMQLEITKKITEIEKKIESRKEDELHKKTEVIYISESEIGKIDPTLQNITNVRRIMLKSVNSERKRELLNALIQNTKLNIAAQKQAEYLSQTNDFYHTSKTGSTPADRATTQGYIFMIL